MTLKTIKFHIKKVFLATGSFIFIYLLLYAYHIVAPAHILFPPKDVRANFYDHSAVFDKFNKGELWKECNTNSTNEKIKRRHWYFEKYYHINSISCFLVGGPEDAKHCPVRKQVTFAKTHKTGSSTVQNILFRYGQRHNLSFAFPLKNTWMFNLSKPFEVSNFNMPHV